MLKISFTPFLLLIGLVCFGQTGIDVLHYRFDIRLSDNTDSIYCTATILVKAVNNLDSFNLDLVGPNNGKGMTVKQVIKGNSASTLQRFAQTGEKLNIQLTEPLQKGEELEIVISYSGIPADGLIISKNKFGHRTFFADNWPNRAHNWIACSDNPADKASVEFVVTAPSHYQVISNGILVEESNLPDNKKLTHWKEDVVLPTKVMVIGAADFAVQYTGNVDCIPVSTWVFPENRKEGFSDYASCKEILSFLNSYIGSYPYKKLANVQSKTTFGGMENANAIFYFENSVDGKKDQETLFAHEIAHQWFGNMATEKSFAHLWLSEGFATYLTIIYMEKKYGPGKAMSMREEDRDQVIDFVKSSDHSIVDSISPYMSLLNPNSYQKGGWVLHMLRRQIGDSSFHKAIQQYYASYAGKNADTRDLEHVFEKVSGQDLSGFFQQWLYTPGIPSLDIKWNYDAKGHKLNVTVQQLQKTPFRFPLEVSIETSSVKSKTTTLQVTEPKQTFSLSVSENPRVLKFDPDVNLLFEGKITQGR